MAARERSLRDDTCVSYSNLSPTSKHLYLLLVGTSHIEVVGVMLTMKDSETKQNVNNSNLLLFSSST